MPYPTLPAATKVKTLDRIVFAGSPFYVDGNRSLYELVNPKFATLSLWIWKGDINDPVTNSTPPTFSLEKAWTYRSTQAGAQLNFEISEYLKANISPTMFFDVNSVISNEGVYFQYVYEVKNSSFTVLHTYNSPTMFATLGYNWDYEGYNTFAWNNGSFGVNTSVGITDTVPTTPVVGTVYRSQCNTLVPRYYSPHVQYYQTKINLNASTSTSVVYRDYYNAPVEMTRCSKDPYLIIYLNKMGFWDHFTPNGKVVVSNKISRDSYSNANRNPRYYNAELDFSKQQLNLRSEQNYIVNTGSLTEEMGQIVEEILYSPRVYLIKFDKNISAAGAGLTADNMIVSADNMTYSADAMAGPNGFYTGYQQIPVLVVDSDFGRKTRLNDKNKINYNIKFETTTSKISSK